VLTRSTPKARAIPGSESGQRGSFYALPQSPQLFKQLLMVAGLDRYYRSFAASATRTSAPTGNRSSRRSTSRCRSSSADVMAVVEPMIAQIFAAVRGRPTAGRSRARLRRAMLRYGTRSARPARRARARRLLVVLCGTGFRVLAEALAAGHPIRGLAAPGAGAVLSRRELDDLVGFATQQGARGLTWIRIGTDGWQSPAVKFLSDAERERLAAAARLGPGRSRHSSRRAGAARVEDPGAGSPPARGTTRSRRRGEDRFLWVVDFPLLQHDPDAGRHVAVHHPFTAPVDADLERLERERSPCARRPTIWF